MSKKVWKVGDVIPVGTTVWKSAFLKVEDHTTQVVIVKMKVTSPGIVPVSSDNWDTGVTDISMHKCRVAAVRVASIRSKNGTYHKFARSHHDTLVHYRVGQVYRPKKFDKTTRQCTDGVHCFLRQKGARNYA